MKESINYGDVALGILILAAGAIFIVGLYESVLFMTTHLMEIFGGLIVIAGFFGLWGVARLRTETKRRSKRR